MRYEEFLLSLKENIIKLVGNLQNINSDEIKDLVYISFSRAIIIFCQFIYIKLYTNYLIDYELGIYFFLITVSYSLNAFLFVPVDYYQQSKIYPSIASNISLKTYLVFNKKLISYVLLLATLAIIAFLFVMKSIAIYISITVLMSILLYMNTALRGLLNNLEHRKIVAGNMSLEALFKVIFFYVSVYLIQPTSITLFVSNVVALFLCLLLMSYNTRSLKLFRGGLMKEVTLREVFVFSYPISIGAVINWVQVQGYRMLLVPLGFAEVVGIYSAVSGIGMAGMSAYSMIYNQIFIPIIYKTDGRYVKVFIRNALFAIGVIIFISYFLSDIIVKIATKSEFLKYSKIILYGIITEGSNLICGSLGIYLAIKNRTLLGMKVSLLGLMSMAIGFSSIFLINIINVYSIGLPIIISQVTVVLWAFYYVYMKESKNV